MQYEPGTFVNNSIKLHVLFKIIYCCSSPDVDVDELESLRTRKKELEDAISDLEISLKVLQSEQRHYEDEAAKLERERVSQMTECCTYHSRANTYSSLF